MPGQGREAGSESLSALSPSLYPLPLPEKSVHLVDAVHSQRAPVLWISPKGNPGGAWALGLLSSLLVWLPATKHHPVGQQAWQSSGCSTAVAILARVVLTESELHVLGQHSAHRAWHTWPPGGCREHPPSTWCCDVERQREQLCLWEDLFTGAGGTLAHPSSPPSAPHGFYSPATCPVTPQLHPRLLSCSAHLCRGDPGWPALSATSQLP